MISNLLNNKILGKIFHTQLHCLQEALTDCESVLDIGCGPNSPVKSCRGLKRTVGVEAYLPYLEQAKKNATHTEFINAKAQNLDFPPCSLDAVVLVEVLEHLPAEEGAKLLAQAQKWAKKKLVLTTPNGFVDQSALDENSLQKHLSGWKVEDLEKLGFSCRGLAGLKALRQGREGQGSMSEDLTVSIRFRPRIFWFGVAALSQIFTYFFPRTAFELFCVKEVNRG